MCLQRLHLAADLIRLQHRDSSLLKRHIRTTIQITPTRANSLDKLLGAHDPCDSPSRKAEALREAVDDEDVVFVYVLDVLGRADSRAVAVAGIVIAAIELIHYEGGAVAADVLDLC